MKKDVQEYFISIQKQYNSLNKILEKVNKEISEGLVSAEQRDNFMNYYNIVKANYERISYIYHLLCLPPKPIRKLKEYFLVKKNEKAMKEFAKNSTLEEVIAENDDALQAMEDELDKVKHD